MYCFHIAVLGRHSHTPLGCGYVSIMQKHCDFDIKSTTSDDKFIAEESYQKEETSDFAIDLVSIKNPGADGFET